MFPIQYIRMLNNLRASGRVDSSLSAQRFYQAMTRHRAAWQASPIRRRLLNSYLAARGIRKLMLGAGSNLREGWLITDITPQSTAVMYLDVTKPFPFEDNTFEYIHAEHLIEHIPWNDGLRMLRECRRVLKPGGIIRIATPDLAVLIGLYKTKLDQLGQRYIEWITDLSLEDLDTYKAAFVINNAFTNWGHKFLYDGELLELALTKAGFTNVREFLMGESDDENLRGIESHGELAANEEMVAFETMVFEASRPAES
jgi:predicted SAM-dependent methyltransferase